MVGEGDAGGRVDADDDRRDAGLVGLRHGLVGEHVLHRDGDHLADVGAGVVRACAHRPARVRVEHAALRHDELDLVEEAFVLRDLRIHHRGDLRDRVAARVAERRPRLELRARVGAGEVDEELFAVDGDLHVQVHVGVAERIVVDVRVGLVHAVGPRRDLFAEAVGRVVDHEVDGLLDAATPTWSIISLSRSTRELRGADLRAQVTDERRGAVVRLQRVQDVAPFDAAVDDLHGRPAHTFAPQVGGGHVVPAGDAAAGVAVVALDARDQDHPARPGAVVGEHRCEHVVVGEVAAAVVRVVGDEDVTLAELVAPEELEREPNGQRRREHELGDADRQRREAPLAVEDRGVALVALVQDRRGGGARHVGGHLEADGLHRATDDLGGDRVDARVLAEAPAAAGKLDQVDVGHRVPLARSALRTRFRRFLTPVSAPIVATATVASGPWLACAPSTTTSPSSSTASGRVRPVRPG